MGKFIYRLFTSIALAAYIFVVTAVPTSSYNALSENTLGSPCVSIY